MTTNEDLGIYVWDNLGAHDRKFIFDCNTIRLPVRTNRMRDRLRFLLLAILNGLRLNAKRDFDSIVGVYPDEFDLYAAYLLHLLTGKPLIVYMHDLYTELRKNARVYEFLKFAEDRIFSSASAVLVTNERFRDYYIRRGIKNAIVFPSCIDLDGYKMLQSSQSKEPSNKRLKIVFTGTIYGSNEDAVETFLRTTEEMNDVEVVFATPKKNMNLKVSIGFLPKKKCFELQRNADVLFLPLSFKYSSPEEIKCAFPCKILEYLAAGRPILGVVPPGSFAEELIRKYDVGIAVTEPSQKKIADAISKLKDDSVREKYSRNASKTALLFDAKIRSSSFCSLVRAILNNSVRFSTDD